MYPFQPNYQYPYNVPRQPVTQALNGRMVTNLDEARAAQIDLDGSLWYFPCPAEGKIYTKTINMQGLPVFNTYKVDNVNNYEQKGDFSTQLLTLNKKVEDLEKIVKELKKYEPSTDDEPLTV